MRQRISSFRASLCRVPVSRKAPTSIREDADGRQFEGNVGRRSSSKRGALVPDVGTERCPRGESVGGRSSSECGAPVRSSDAGLGGGEPPAALRKEAKPRKGGWLGVSKTTWSSSDMSRNVSGTEGSQNSNANLSIIQLRLTSPPARWSLPLLGRPRCLQDGSDSNIARWHYRFLAVCKIQLRRTRLCFFLLPSLLLTCALLVRWYLGPLHG